MIYNLGLFEEISRVLQYLPMFASTFLFRISTKALVYVFLRHFSLIFYIIIFSLLEVFVNWPLSKKGYLPKYKNKWHLSVQSSFTVFMYPLDPSATHFRKYHLLFWLIINETVLLILLGNWYICKSNLYVLPSFEYGIWSWQIWQLQIFHKIFETDILG